MNKIIFGMAVCVALPLVEVAQAVQFQDTTTSSGISYVGQSWGGAWGDFNGDGFYDLWTPNHGSIPSLLINQQDGTFIDQTSVVFPAAVLEYYQTALGSYDMHGAVWFDFDKDGDMDLFQAADGGFRMQPNHLYVNDAGKVFSAEVGAATGVDMPSSNSTMPLPYDWNQDGLPDLFVAGNPRNAGTLPVVFLERNASTLDFTDAAAAFGLTVSGATHFGRVTDLDGDTVLELMLGPTPASVGVYEFNTPLPDDITSILDLGAETHMVDAVVADFDGDLDDDIFVVRGESTFGLVQENDFRVEASVSVNGQEHGFSFKTAGQVAIEFFPIWQISLSSIYIGNMGNHPNAIQFTLSPDDAVNHGIVAHTPGVDRGHYVGYDPTTETWTVLFSFDVYANRSVVVDSDQTISELQAIGFEPGQFTPSDLYYHNDNGVFLEQAAIRGFSVPSSGRNIGAGDFDNDGDIDLYVVASGAVQNKPNITYINDGTGHFVTQPDGAGAAGGTAGRGDAVAVADYDNDGFLDLFVTNGKDRPPFFLDGPYYLFRNQGNANHWLEIQLVGSVSATSGTGAIVEILAGGQSQRRMQGGGVHYRAQDMQRLHFGLGTQDRVQRIDVLWPSGRQQMLQAVPVDQILTITEPLTDSDSDMDGVLDALDNCLSTSNPLQHDTDGDGYGNACDADFNNDCVINFADLSLFGAAFLGSDVLFDLNADGNVNFADIAIFADSFLTPPGPSGTSMFCSGS